MLSTEEIKILEVDTVHKLLNVLTFLNIFPMNIHISVNLKIPHSMNRPACFKMQNRNISVGFSVIPFSDM